MMCLHRNTFNSHSLNKHQTYYKVIDLQMYIASLSQSLIVIRLSSYTYLAPLMKIVVFTAIIAMLIRDTLHQKSGSGRVC